MTWALAALLAASAAVELYQKANSLFQRQKFPESLAAVEQALQLDPKLAPAWTLKAKLDMAANRMDLARESLARAVEADPSFAYAQFLFGFYYYLENDFEKALPPLERAREQDPADPRPRFYLALSHEGMGRAGQALVFYRQALELEDQQGRPLAETRVAFGRFLFSLGRYEESAQAIDHALALDPHSRDAHYERGRLLFESSDFPGAARHGEKALSLTGMGTSDRSIHFLLGRAYLKTGRKDLADLHLAKFRASAPSLRR